MTRGLFLVLYRALLHTVPAEPRRELVQDADAILSACIGRARADRGTLGETLALARALVDLAAFAVAARRHLGRDRRLARLHARHEGHHMGRLSVWFSSFAHDVRFAGRLL